MERLVICCSTAGAAFRPFGQARLCVPRTLQQRSSALAASRNAPKRRSSSRSSQAFRCRAEAAAPATVPTAAPGATKIGFLGIGIMGNAMVRGSPAHQGCGAAASVLLV